MTQNVLINALKASGDTLLEYFNTPLEAKFKESQSNIVTEADIKSDKVIVKIIRDNFPDHNVLTEESGFVNNNSKYTWVVDSLDGTSNFTAHIPWFGVLISIFENNIPVMGGAYLPVQNDLYIAEKGKGVMKNGQPLVMLKNKGLRNSLIAFSVDYSEDEVFLRKEIEIYKYIVKSCRNIRSTNSLVDFIYVAEGKFGGCINLLTRVWDISALGLIISEAGGCMKDVEGNNIQFSMDDHLFDRNFPVIAGSEEFTNSLKEIFIM
jgi:myo-inositol-1(or 4)-monophosphatase